MVQGTAAEIALIGELIRGQFGATAEGVTPLDGGAFSRAFACTAAGRAYVVRLNALEQAPEIFAKDAYAWRHFASAAVPIPRLIATGQRAGVHYAISERVAGRRLEELSSAARRALLPATLDLLAAIGRVDVRASRGYGPWDGAGTGAFASWRAFLAEIIENRAEGFYRDWHALFRESFLEREVCERIYRHMLRLADACPEERALLHCDLHHDNLLTDGHRITGVIDWANACYGDPLYDVAWLGWWFDKYGYRDGATLLRARHAAAPRFAERIACYECHFGLDDLRFYAKLGQREQYVWTRDRLLAKIAGGAA